MKAIHPLAFASLALTCASAYVTFNFITIAGHLHLKQIAPKDMKGLAKRVMMLMSNGIGATTGILVAGEIVNHWCRWEMVPISDSTVRLFIGEWIWPWLIFASYALLVTLFWIFLFRPKMDRHIRNL